MVAAQDQRSHPKDDTDHDHHDGGRAPFFEDRTSAQLRVLCAGLAADPEPVSRSQSRLPYYRLGQVLRDHPGLKDVGRITLGQSIGCVRFALWDEARGRMISFRQLRAAKKK